MVMGEIDNGGLLDDLPPPYVEVAEPFSLSVRGRRGAV